MQPPPVSKRVFDKYDKDKSGKLDRWEFGEMVFEMGYKLNAQELELAVKKLDQHGGGIVYADFAQWWKSDQRFAHLQLSEEELAKLQKAQTYFNHFDKDRSGVLSVQEFKPLHADLVKHNYPIPKDLNKAIEELDTDRSGEISFNEFTSWLARKTKAVGK